MTARTRTIAVVTGSRAEFGLLEPVMRAIDGFRPTNRSTKRPAIKLKLHTIVAGSHLVADTLHDIREAGFRIDAKVPMQRAGAVGRGADVQALGRGITGMGKALAKLKPDVVVVLGDRIEAMAGACAASVGGIHVAHIHGGDRAQGVADEAMRHAISKLAHLHLVATDTSRNRLVRMGEPAKRVVNVGSPAMDGLGRVKPDPDAPELIVIQHPIGAPDAQERQWMLDTLRATARYRRVVLTPNLDPGCRGIRMALRAERVLPVKHMPRQRFLSQLAGAKAIVGNSSAGLIEAAALKVSCVNVGSRQDGRDKPSNVVDCGCGRRAVSEALSKAMGLNLKRMGHPYGSGRTGRRIARLLATIDLAGLPVRKRNAY